MVTEATETEVAAEKQAAEEKTAVEKAAAEEQTKAEDLGKDFDKKADEPGEEHSAYTETPEDKEARETAEAEAKAKADEKSSEEKASDDEVDESLLERAEEAGMTREKAGEFGSKEDLERACELLEERQDEEAMTPEEVEAEKQAKADVEAKIEDDKKPYDCGLDPAEYDEDLIKVLNELGTDLKKRVVALEGSHTTNRTAIDSDRVMRNTDWLDSKFNRMSDEALVKVYGEGDIEDIDEGSDQFKARAKLDIQITKIAGDFRRTKKPMPSRNKLFDLAIETLHKGKSTKKVDAKTAAKLEARKKQALGPGSTKVSAETAETKALQTNKDFDSKLDDED